MPRKKRADHAAVIFNENGLRHFVNTQLQNPKTLEHFDDNIEKLYREIPAIPPWNQWPAELKPGRLVYVHAIAETVLHYLVRWRRITPLIERYLVSIQPVYSVTLVGESSSPQLAVRPNRFSLAQWMAALLIEFVKTADFTRLGRCPYCDSFFYSKNHHGATYCHERHRYAYHNRKRRERRQQS